MKNNRREFLAQMCATGAGAVAGTGNIAVAAVISDATVTTSPSARPKSAATTADIDFRFAPASWQTAYCLPDDPHKSLVGERGELRYGYNRDKGVYFFPVLVEFTTGGMGADELVSQRIEDAAVPIVHTLLRRGRVEIELITFATRTQAEGRVDNVIAIYRPARGAREVNVYPTVHVRSIRDPRRSPGDEHGVVRWDNDTGPLFIVCNRALRGSMDERRPGVVRTDVTAMFEFGRGLATTDVPVRAFFRFPQEQQKLEQVTVRLNDPDTVLAEAREGWKQWKPFGGAVAWSIPGRPGEFLTACARNIQQAREDRGGKLTFQVGPANYRGLWVVDGNFILEAARYLGYDIEAQKGLETTWASQREDGGVFAGGGGEHWKDTAIAMFTLVRHAELSQDWTYFRKMTPQLLKANQFLVGLRDKAKKDGSINGSYGLLAPGFADGGLWGVRNEFTNTLWVLAGLKAVADAADKQEMASEFAPVKAFHSELNVAFLAAADKQMREHPAGFRFLSDAAE